MEVPPPEELLEHVRALPAAAPLEQHIGMAPGVHLVGGAVRDLLLGGRPSDLDLVVEGDAAAFARKLGGEVRVHDRFGTSTVRLAGRSYDIARARRERYSHPGALPDVEPAPIEEDLLRRDFAVNALAVALGPPRPGQVSAAPGAIEDLGAHILRVLHDRSFLDDPTRLLRLARYASRLAFEVEPHTNSLAEEAVQRDALSTVSGARLGAELRLLAREPDPVAGFKALHELKLDTAIHGGFGLVDERLARLALELLPGDGRQDRLVLALAAVKIPPEQLSPFLDRLAFEGHDRDAIVATASRAQQVAAALERAESPSQIAAAAGGLAPELVAHAGALGPARAATEWLRSLRNIRLEITGEDLLAAGIPQGPAIGQGLNAALVAKLDGRLSGREQELRVAVQAAWAAR